MVAPFLLLSGHGSSDSAHEISILFHMQVLEIDYLEHLTKHALSPRCVKSGNITLLYSVVYFIEQGGYRFCCDIG